jgi:hypothetical protein
LTSHNLKEMLKPKYTTSQAKGNHQQPKQEHEEIDSK